jgi:hypothetical protein
MRFAFTGMTIAALSYTIPVSEASAIAPPPSPSQPPIRFAPGLDLQHLRGGEGRIEELRPFLIGAKQVGCGMVQRRFPALEVVDEGAQEEAWVRWRQSVRTSGRSPPKPCDCPGRRRRWCARRRPGGRGSAGPMGAAPASRPPCIPASDVAVRSRASDTSGDRSRRRSNVADQVFLADRHARLFRGPNGVGAPVGAAADEPAERLG